MVGEYPSKVISLLPVYDMHLHCAQRTLTSRFAKFDHPSSTVPSFASTNSRTNARSWFEITIVMFA